MRLIRRPVQLGLLPLAAWSLIAVVSATTTRAADPSFVGVLSLAVDDQGAKHLGLSEDVREKLRRLVERREKDATNLALSIKDLPPDIRAERLAPFVVESERQGMELLTQEQRSKLNQLRLQRTGMASLAEAETAQLLELTAQQRDAVTRLMADRATAMTRGGDAERRVARSTYERQLRSVLTSAQKATWDQMAGLGPGPTAPAVVDTKPKPAAAATAAEPTAESAPVAQPMADTESAPAATVQTLPQAVPAGTAARGAPTEPPADTASPEAAPPGDAGEGAAQPKSTADQPSAAPDAWGDTGLEQAAPKDVKLRFNFRFQPWGDVLDWLAEQADLSLQSTLVPEGTFNYSDTHEYTPTEAIDLINGVLLTQGYTLVRRGRLLTVINLEDEVPDVLVEFVPVEKLDGRGEFELLKTVFHLAKMDPADAEQEIQQLLGPGRKMIMMPKSRQILVTETAGKLRTIRDVIERAENPTGIKDKGVAEIQLKFVSPEEVLLIARPLLGLEDGKNVGTEVSIAVDAMGTRLFATGSRDKIQILQDLVEKVDKKREMTAAAVAMEQPQLQSHQIQAADPQEALAVMQTLLAGLPDVRMSLDTKTNKIIALARPSEHRTIQETIRQLEGESPQFEVIQLRKIDPKMAVLTINKFFPPGKDGESGGITVDADPTTLKLYVRAARQDLDQVRALIERLEGSGEEGGSTSTLRFIPMTGNAAVSAVEMAERLWRGPNQIRMTTPSETGPGIFDLREISPEEPARPKTPSQAPSAKPRVTTTKQTATQPDPSQPAAEPSRDKVTVDNDPPYVESRIPIHFASLQAVDETQDTAQSDTPQENAAPAVSPATSRGCDARAKPNTSGERGSRRRCGNPGASARQGE